MAAVTLTAKTIELANRIRKEIVDEELIKVRPNGTFYMVEKTDYSFNCYFIYNDGVFTKPTIDEITYDLKNRVYKILRNDKEVSFTEDNLKKCFDRQMTGEDMTFFEALGNAGFFKETKHLGVMGSERESMISRQLVRLMEDYPSLEFVYKAGFPIKMFCTKYNEMYSVSTKAKNLLEFYGFEYKAQLKILKALYQAFEGTNESRTYGDSNYNSLHKLVKAFTIEDCDFVRNLLALASKNNKKYAIDKSYAILQTFGLHNQSSFQTYVGYNQQSGKNEYKKQYLEVMSKYVTDLPRFIEYVFYEMDVKQANTNYRIYQDYIRMSLALGGKFDRYPTSIAMAHDIAQRFYNIVCGWGNSSDKFREAVKPLTDYECEIKGTKYCIVAPKEVTDIINEGQVLSHCVKSYIPSIINEGTIIIFLRNKQLPEEPLYTIELKNNEIVQARGKFNCELADDAKKALSIFAKDFMLSENY